MSSGQQGQATVELALCLPLVAALLALVVEVGGVVADNGRLWHAAREAARVSAVEGSTAKVMAAARAVGPGRLQVEITPEERYRIAGGSTTVRLRHEPRGRIPLVGRLVPGRVLEVEATMRIEDP